jgi:hypothetical protein
LAANDYYHVTKNSTLTVGAATGLLANDFDPDNNPIVATSFSQPAHGSLSVSLDGSLTYTPTANYVGTDSFSYYISDGALTATAIASIDVVSCFCAGTLIQTANGDVPVEKLAVGDRLVTYAGPVRRIHWIGHRHISVAGHPDPGQVRPIRVRAGAFGDGRPVRDLMLSPDHAVFVDSALIPIRHLTNGCSVAPLACEMVTYFHVLLDCHDVLLAEGMPCESLLDMQGPARFDNAHTAPDTLVFLEPCAPILTQGVRVEHVRQSLNARLAMA